MRMKGICAITVLVALMACLTACFGSVVPAAWVKLDMEGHVVYTANMYPSSGDHIYLYESEQDAADDTYHADYALAITFYPRILGADTVNGERTTIVDISSYCTMTVYINKTKSVYAADKNIYLNGTKLVADLTNDFDTLLCLSFEHFTLERGNPGGRENGIINRIEYR